ncbi:AI-2E family transporter [Bacillus shivajii]|uniref:AI-2E family transporter n=1 Tax=Bacillus shivajii TaxID=1983719 RepID=UPI001CFAF98F|nr:AI-2E family transporter [Bacillus shivajii]UCZ54385.1 AI-2E family transporter [Bacillus shivajii]
MENAMIKWMYRLILFLLIGLFIILLLYLFSLIQPVIHVVFRILMPFLFAGFIAYLIHPFIFRLEKRKIPRSIAILIVYGVFILVFSWVVLKLTPYVIKEGQEFINQLPEMTNTYRNFVGTVNDTTSTLPDSFQERAEQWIASGEAMIADMLIGVSAVIRQLFDWLIFLIVVPFLTFYLLKDMELVKKVVWYFTPVRFRKEGYKLIREIDHSLGNYIRGQLTVCIIVGIIAFIGFTLIDLPYATLLAIFVGATNIIPYFGPIIGGIPVLIVALTESFHLVLFALLVNFTIQTIEGNILAPLIVGKSVHMHPVMIIFALIVGGEIAGIVGLIIAVPLLTVFKVILLHVRRIFRERKGVYY